MVKQVKISSFNEVKSIVAAATLCMDQIGVHDQQGSIADAKSILGNKEENRKIYDKLTERKVIEALEPAITVTPTSISAEEFAKLVEKVYMRQK